MARRRRYLTTALSVGGHALLVLALMRAQPAPLTVARFEPITVQMIEAPPPPPPPPAPQVEPEPSPKPAQAKPAPPKPAPPKPPPKRKMARPARAPPPADAIPVSPGDNPTSDGVAEVGEGELARAGTADSGSGGGRGCNMTRRLQNALRKDPMVQAAVSEVHRGKAIRIWNGDWVRHGAQEGSGLAAVREAIMWEVGFAPEACRTERMHGLILISLNDTPGAPRVVLGQSDWRWSDMLFARGPRAGGAKR